VAGEWRIKNDYQWQMFCDHVGRLRMAGKTPAFKELSDKRSADQNSISHAWYTEVSRALQDRSPLSVKCESKLNCGVPILRAEDDDFRSFYDASIKSTLSYEQKMGAMKFLPVTSLMSVQQLSQYLEDVQQFWGRQGVFLAFPDDYSRQQYPEAV
jgi:hypothetical protein